MRAKIGRPKNIDNLELVTLEECVKRLREFWQTKEGDPDPYCKRTLQNKIYQGIYKRYGPRLLTLLDWHQVKAIEETKLSGKPHRKSS